MTLEPTFKCSCGKKMIIPSEMRGKPLKCPRCGKKIAPAPAVQDLSDDSAQADAVEEQEEVVVEPGKDKGRPRSSRRGASRKGARGTTGRRKRTARAGGAEEEEAAKPRAKSPRGPRAIDVVRGDVAPDPDAAEQDAEAKKSRRRKETSRRPKPAPSEEPPPVESSVEDEEVEPKARSKRTAPDTGRSKKKAAASTRKSARTPAPASSRRKPGADDGPATSRSKRTAGGGSPSRRTGSETPPEKPGLLGLFGLVGATFQLLFGATLAFTALISPAFLAPAGFQLQEGSAKGIVIGFGALFLVTGILTELALFKYIKNAGKIDALMAGGGSGPAAGAPAGRARRAPVEDESDLDEDLGDEDFDSEWD